MLGICKIAAALVVVWAAVEIVNEGMDGAFGGMFAASARSNPLERTASAPQRAKQATEAALQANAERRARLLGN
jgi:hypothetical protein